MNGIVKPVFFDTDPKKQELEVVEIFEGIIKRKLYPAQLENLILKVITYVGATTRADVHAALLQNLVQFAEGSMLDQHAINRSIRAPIERIKASKAITTIRFSMDEAIGEIVTIPAKTAVTSKDGAFTFETNHSVIIPIGQTFIDVAATATIEGASANGLNLGTLTELEEPIAYIDQVINISVSSGGADIESDEHFKPRIMSADNLISTGGPYQGYIDRTFGAHADVRDVTVKSPLPNDIHIYPLLSSGIASAEIKQIIHSALSADTERPLGDLVILKDPTAVIYALNVEYYIEPNKVEAQVNHALEAAATAITQKWQVKLGQDIIPSEIIATLQAVEGVNHIKISAIPNYQALTDIQFPFCTNVNISNLGVYNG